MPSGNIKTQTKDIKTMQDKVRLFATVMLDKNVEETMSYKVSRYDLSNRYIQ